jgi:hypothetical protein
MKTGTSLLLLFSVAATGLLAQPAGLVESRGVSVRVPTGCKCNDRLLAAGGPIACTNFSEGYARGGLLPPDGAEIEITTVQRPVALDAYARSELKGVRELKLQEAPVEGKPALRTSYKDEVAPGVSTDNFVYYVAQGSRLYKFYLTYHSGNSQSAALVRTWDAVVHAAVLK